VIYTPAVVDASVFRLLLTVLTGWLDRQEREVLRYLIEETLLVSGPRRIVRATSQALPRVT
jgi:hypothetical protein